MSISTYSSLTAKGPYSQCRTNVVQASGTSEKLGDLLGEDLLEGLKELTLYNGDSTTTYFAMGEAATTGSIPLKAETSITLPINSMIASGLQLYAESENDISVIQFG